MGPGARAEVGRARSMKVLSTESEWGKVSSRFPPPPTPTHQEALAETSEEDLRPSPKTKKPRIEGAWARKAQMQRA